MSIRTCNGLAPCTRLPASVGFSRHDPRWVFRTMITVHADVVGSLLRPPELIAARARLAAGEIDASRFREIEDRAVWMNGRGSDFPF